MKSEEILLVVKERYSKAAQTSDAGPGSCCCPSVAPPGAGFAAQQGLYTPEDLASVPELAVKLSRGCGNLVSIADLRPGEVVVDLGCGAGIDVILAARRITPGGKVVGVDFAQPMIERATQAVTEAGLTISYSSWSAIWRSRICRMILPMPSSPIASSICAHKEAVYRHAFRILKRGGRLAISDVVYSEKPPPEVKSRFEATWAGCVGGAMEEQAYFDLIKKAGFEKIRIVARHSLGPMELEEMASCPGPEFAPRPEKEDLAAVQGTVTSIKFTAAKPKKGPLRYADCSPASSLLWKGLTSPARSSSASIPHLPGADRSNTAEAAKQEISRFSCKERTYMPGSKTTQGRTGTRFIVPIRVAFRYANSVDTLN